MSYFNFMRKIGYFQLLKLKGQISFYAIMFYTVFSLHIVFLHFLHYTYQADKSQYKHPKGNSHFMIVPCILIISCIFSKLTFSVVNDDYMT